MSHGPDRIAVVGVDLPRHHNGPLNPWVLEHGERGGIVAGVRVPLRLPADARGLERALVAEHKLLHHLGDKGRKRPLQGRLIGDAMGAHGGGTIARLEHHGQTDLFDECPDLQLG